MAGGYYGAYKPPKEVLPKFFMYTEYLRKRVPSFMLNVYLDALKGKFGKNRYRVAYFNGVFKVEPYHSLYHTYKERKMAAGYSKLHAHRLAMRKVGYVFIRDVFRKIKQKRKI